MAFPYTYIFNFTLFITTIFSLLSYSNSMIPSDVDLIEFALNLEYLEAEYFLYGSLGYGLDVVAPELAMGGPSPIGLKKALLDPISNGIIYQFGLQELGHLRAIKSAVKGFPRPLINLGSPLFGEVMDFIFAKPLNPPFDPYANTLNYLIGCYMIPYLGLTGLIGANPMLISKEARHLVAALLGVESGQDAVIRTLLYERRLQRVYPYDITVQEFTNKISDKRNVLAHSGNKDEGLFVNPALGAEGKTPLNILSADEYSIGYGRAPEEILRIVYSSGSEKIIGGFYPKGANGTIARSHLIPL